MQEQTYRSNVVFEEDVEKYDISELIQQRAEKATTFALVSMIISGALFLLLIGSFLFALLFPAGFILAIIMLPISFVLTLIELALMVTAIILNIIALKNAIQQKKEFSLYKDGPEKDILEAKIKRGQIFTYIGVGVAALSLLLIIPLNVIEFLCSIIS